MIVYQIYIYIDDGYDWDKEIENYKIQYEKRQEKKYKDKQSRQDQDEVIPPSQENSTPVNQDQPRPDGKFIELGVLTDSVLLAKATTLANYSDNIDCFHSNQAIDEEKNDVPQNSLCLLFSTENKIFRIVEIMSHCSYQEKTEGCFVTYRENLNYELSDDDIREILEKKEEYKIISDPKDMEKLPYDTLKDFKEKVKEYREMLKDPNYQKGLEKAKNKMESEIDRLFESESDVISMKEQLKKFLQSI